VEELPTLESILMEPDYESLSETEDDIGLSLGEKLGSSETISIGSHLSLNSLNKSSKTAHKSYSGVILRHVILKGITSQIISANVSNYCYTLYRRYKKSFLQVTNFLTIVTCRMYSNQAWNSHHY